MIPSAGSLINALRLGLLLVYLAWVSPALADETDLCVSDSVCKEHEDLALSLSAAKDYTGALTEFRAAYARVPIARLLINIGRSFFRIGKPREALKYYGRFLRVEPNADTEITQRVHRYMNEAEAAALNGPDALDPPGLPTEAPLRQSPNAELKLPGSGEIEPAVGNDSLPATTSPHRSFPAGAVSLVTLGVAGLVVCTGLGIRTKDLSAEFLSDSGPFNRDLYSQGQTMSQVAIAFGVWGGASIVAGSIWLAVWGAHSKTDSKRRRTASQSILIEPGSG